MDGTGSVWVESMGSICTAIAPDKIGTTVCNMDRMEHRVWEFHSASELVSLRRFEKERKNSIHASWYKSGIIKLSLIIQYGIVHGGVLAEFNLDEAQNLRASLTVWLLSSQMFESVPTRSREVNFSTTKAKKRIACMTTVLATVVN